MQPRAGQTASTDIPALPWSPGHRSGYVAVAGAPNVGKSTLINAYLGEKIAIVSPKPQTTRHRVLGILTRDDAQVIFVDTPGLHRPSNRLGDYMVEVAREALKDSDAILWLVDAAQPPGSADEAVAQALSEVPETATALVLNKTDLVEPALMEEREAAYRHLAPVHACFRTSATVGTGLDQLLSWVISELPEGPRYYPADQIAEREERFFTAELIREQILHHLRQEVPHSIAVTVDEFKERPNGVAYIAATLYVEKESQKGIVIGAGGGTLKRVSIDARREIERFLGRPVYLELWVKVRRNWRRNEARLRELGYRVARRAN